MSLRNVRAMVFAAGLGSRLQPLTHRLPKPAVPVANRPLASYMLSQLAHNGVREVVLNTHHLAEALRPALEPYIPQALSAEFVHEKVILGTGGGLRHAWRPIAGETFLVANGDILFAPDVTRALELHRTTGAIATMVLRTVPDPDRYGSIEIEPGSPATSGRVRRILGQPADATRTYDKYMFTGVHLLDARAWHDLPENGCIIRSSYRQWLERGETVMACIDDSPWYDLGTPRTYLEANLALATGVMPWPSLHPDPCGLVVDPSVDLPRDARVTQSVLGAGVRLLGPLWLRQVVAWPGATLTESDSRAIYLSDGQRIPVDSAPV